MTIIRISINRVQNLQTFANPKGNELSEVFFEGPTRPNLSHSETSAGLYSIANRCFGIYPLEGK